MKYLMTLATILGALFWFLVSGFNTANANAGEITTRPLLVMLLQILIKLTIQIIEQEMQKFAYVMMLQMADTLEKTMPYIIDDITSQLRQESDSYISVNY
jgi:hypothetical protein